MIRECKDPRVKRVIRAKLALLVPRVIRVTRACKERRVTRACRVSRVKRVTKVTREKKATKVI